MTNERKGSIPALKKTDISAEVFKLLGIREEIRDNSERTLSGGGGTVTKSAWEKVLNRLIELSNTGELKIASSKETGP